MAVLHANDEACLFLWTTCDNGRKEGAEVPFPDQQSCDDSLVNSMHLGNRSTKSSRKSAGKGRQYKAQKRRAPILELDHWVSRDNAGEPEKRGIRN